MASRLLNVLQDVEKGRQSCVKNARLANLPATDTMSIDELGQLFLEKNTPEQIVPGWERPEDWWDCESILNNAENIEENGVVFYPAYIILLADWDKSTTFSKTTTYSALRGDGYLTSDGTWYNTSTVEHTWDETKDKPCSEGYKTRYVLVYTTTPENIGGLIDIRTFPCLEIIIGTKINVLGSSGNLQFIAGATNNSSEPHNNIIRNFVCPKVKIVQQTHRLFNFCQGLENLSFPDLEQIGPTAQNWCNCCLSLKNIDLPNLITITGSYTNSLFNSCKALTIVNLPNLVSVDSSRTISLFSECTALREVFLPKLTNAGPNMFYKCSSLKKLSLPKITAINAQSFCNACTALESIYLPELMTISGTNAFSGCLSLTTVYLPKLTTMSGSGTFAGCTNLRNITLPNLTAISEASPFSNCTALETIQLPKWVVFDGSDFCSNNTVLQSLTLPNTMSSIKNTNTYFTRSLLNLNIPVDFKISLNLSEETYLTRSSLIDILNNLADVTEETDTYTLTLGATNLAKLTPEEIAIATNKGWTIQ